MLKEKRVIVTVQPADMILFLQRCLQHHDLMGDRDAFDAVVETRWISTADVFDQGGKPSAKLVTLLPNDGVVVLLAPRRFEGQDRGDEFARLVRILNKDIVFVSASFDPCNGPDVDWQFLKDASTFVHDFYDFLQFVAGTLTRDPAYPIPANIKHYLCHPRRPR